MKKYILIISILLIAVFSYTYLQSNSNIEEKDRDHWKSFIEENGAIAAYSEFKNVNSQVPILEQHLNTHIIGELLYEYEGVEGIAVCDSSFTFGCYHGFFGTALASEGIEIVPRLDKVCLDTYGPLGGGCQHGIGHGIIEYMGYDKLSKALDVCKQVTQITKTIGCTSGIFMEYNTPLVFSGKNVRNEILPFDPEKPYGVCTDVGKEFQPSCYYELAQWWSNSLSQNSAKIATLCDNVLDIENRKYCSLGVGSMIAISTQFDVEESINKCSKVSKNEENMCLAGVTWSFFADPLYKDIAHKICDKLEYNDREICIKEADLTEGLDSNYKSYFE